MHNLPHRRFNPLTKKWVLVSPHRTERPWQGAQEENNKEKIASYDPKCYLCPGNTRANGEVNPFYDDTFVFVNDFAALKPASSVTKNDENHELLQSEVANGECRVICFSKQHNLTLADMTISDIHKVIQVWINEINTLSKRYPWVQVFENKGQIMGCSNPHPHGQVWASQFIPNEAEIENQSQSEYYKKHQRSLLLDYAKHELIQKQRLVCDNQDWLVVVPFWAMWPFETLLLPKFPLKRMPDLTFKQEQSLAEVLKTILMKYDRLFGVSFPYSMGWHGAIEGLENQEHWQLHAHFYPPLLRSATVKKFMVGYEMLAEAQRDLTPEQAAQRLRES